MTVEFGLVVPAGPPKGQLNKWLDDLDAVVPQVEGSFTGLWMTDHFFWGDEPTYEAWTVLTFLAARFPQFKVGPVVLGQSYRNPALLAKMAATLQTLSGGRLIMGIGAGWKEDEYHAYGYPYPSPGVRVEQLEDTLEILTRLWTEPGRVSYQGRHYHITDAYCEPKPDPVPPIIVGGGGRKTTRLAARFGSGWNMPDANYDTYRERITILKNHCQDLGRDPASIACGWFGRLALGRTEAAAQARGGGKWTRDNAFVGTPAQVVEEMSRFIALGCEHFIVEVLDIADPDVLGMALDEVIAPLGASRP